MRGGGGGLQAGVQSVICVSMENPYRYKLIYINIYIYISMRGRWTVTFPRQCFPGGGDQGNCLFLLMVQHQLLAILLYTLLQECHK